MALINKFFHNKKGFYHDKGFDHTNNCVLDYGRTKFDKKDILIIEGTISLQLAKSFDMPNLKVFVDAPLSLRKEKFKNKYEKRNFKTKKIKELWKDRAIFEDEYILKDKEKVDFVFSNQLKENDY